MYTSFCTGNWFKYNNYVNFVALRLISYQIGQNPKTVLLLKIWKVKSSQTV